MNIMKMMVVVLIVSAHCLVQSAATTMSVQEQDKIRQYLYSTKDDFSSFNNETIAQYEQIIQDHMVALKQTMIQKDDADWNIVQGTVLAGFSAVCAYSYYCKIIIPFVVALSLRKGLAHAIEFNKDFIKQHPLLATWYAVPLFTSAVLGKLSYNYFSKSWNDQKYLRIALLQDEEVLARLERVKPA